MKNIINLSSAELALNFGMTNKGNYTDVCLLLFFCLLFLLCFFFFFVVVVCFFCLFFFVRKIIIKYQYLIRELIGCH